MESRFIKALGPLFKMTEVQLWDDISGEGRETSQIQEPSKFSRSDKENSRNHSSSFIDLSSHNEEDTDLIKKLSELGLPLTFHTNKEKRLDWGGNRRKSTRPSSAKVHTKTITELNDLPDSSVEQLDSTSCTSIELSHEIVSEVSDIVSVSGEWMEFWDDFYGRSYFYNATTEESTWDPPPLDDNLNIINTMKKKKKVNKPKHNRRSTVAITEINEIVEEESPIISKYWYQRYLLFSRFDHGIRMDEEGWFSVTPEAIAKHHALRCGDGVVVDFFAGVGGNAIQFAQRCQHVIAVDIDPNKIEYARHNAAIYGVDDKIDFINGDSFSLAPKLKADAVFMSPPWGGPAYSKVEKFDVQTMLKPLDGQLLFDIAKEIAAEIVMFLPRNVDVERLAEISSRTSPPWGLEVEKNFLNGRLKAVTAYFSDTGKRRRSK